MKYTQEQAVEVMQEVHKGFYTYENVVFNGVTSKINVTCPLHGAFITTFTNHTHKTSPRGCPKCGLLRRAHKRTKSKDEFISKAMQVHGERYDYSKITYKNKSEKVEIVCKEHGSFWQTPEKHEYGKGCPSCAGKGVMTLSRFLRDAKSTHGNTYNYSLVTDELFNSAGAIVPIICRTHGVFQQSFSNHTFGQGCPRCARFGFNVEKPGTLYVLSDGVLVKVGITNRDVGVRVKEINKSGNCFKVVKVFYFHNGRDCLDAETKYLRVLRSEFENPDETFSGATESFIGVDLRHLLNMLEEYTDYEVIYE